MIKNFNNGPPSHQAGSKSLDQAKDLDQESLDGLLAQYKHRLLSLEADLVDQRQKGQWATDHVKRRVHQLNSLKKGLSGLFELNRELMENHLYKYDIGLPKLEGMGPLELKICQDFLVSSQKDLQRLLLQVIEVEQWCLEASVGGTHMVQSIIRLSKLGKLIKAMDLATGLTQQEHNKLTEQAHAAIGAFQSPLVKRYLAKNNEKALDQDFGDELQSEATSHKQHKESGKHLIDRLAYWFNRIERQIAKIARSRRELRYLDVKIGQMQAWLQSAPKPSQTPLVQEMPSILGLERDQALFMPLLRLKRAQKINEKAALFLKGLGTQTGQG